MAQKIRRLLFRADRMWLVAVITMFALVTLGYASLLNTQPALAVAPVGASAVIQNSTATTVDVVITGTDFASFVNSGTTTAGASDLTGITYNSVNPSSATTNGTNTITATFPISMGTAVIGNLTIDAGIVQDGVGSGNQNLLITIASGSITDSAKPVPISATFYDATSDDGKLDSVVVVYSEVLTAAADVSADWAISSAANFAGLAEVAALCNSGAAGTNQCLYTFTTTTVKTDVGDLTLTYTAGTSVTDGTNTANTIALSSGSTPAFTDAAAPLLTAVEFTKGTGSNLAVSLNTITLTYSETMTLYGNGLGGGEITNGNNGASSSLIGRMDTAKTIGGIITWAITNGGDMATANAEDITLTKTSAAVITIEVNDQAGSYFASGTTAPTTPVVTVVSDANIMVDAGAGLAVNASQATVNATSGTAWDVTVPTISTTYSCDTDTDGDINRIQATFAEAVLDSSITAGNFEADNDVTNDATGEEVPVSFNTATGGCDGAVDDTDANDDKARFDLTTGITGTESAYLHNVTLGARDLAGNLLAVGAALGTETDRAAPVVMSTSPADAATGVANTSNITMTFSEAMDTTFDEGTEFAVSPDSGSFVATFDGVTDTVVTINPAANLLCLTYTITTAEAEIVAAAGAVTTLVTTGPVDGDFSFSTTGCSSGGGGSAPAPTYGVAINAPNGGEVWSAGSTHDIIWLDSSTGSVDYANLYYSTDGGTVYNSIVAGVTNNGSYSWTTPIMSSTNVALKIELTDLASVVATDTTNQVFTIDGIEAGEPVDAPSTGNQGISPVTGQLEDISVVAAGDYIKSPYFDTVYYIDSAMVRHPFMDRQTYFTWKNSFSSVSIVTDATLMTLSLGSPMMPNPGVVLVKIQSDPKVYMVETNSANMFKPTLRWVTTEGVAAGLYGNNWADYVIDVPVTLFSRFEFGADVTSSSGFSINMSLMKTRVSLNS